MMRACMYSHGRHTESDITENLCNIYTKMQDSQVLGANPYDCGWTGFANQYDRNLYYFVPEGMAITGVESEYGDKYE